VAAHSGHAHPHAHDHAIQASAETVRPLRIALAITTTVLLLELAGGWWTGSIALIADAGHMLTDAGALLVALLALWVSMRPRDSRRSFGYGRTQILGALANGLLLGGVSAAVALESIERLGAERQIAAEPMLAIACIGLAANVATAAVLWRADPHNLNVRAARLHVLGDALGSIGAIGASIAILVFGLQQADAIAGLLIAALVIYSAYALIHDSVDVLLEGVPRHLDLESIGREACRIPGVISIHDLHIWTVGPGFAAMSAHVDLAPGADPERVRRAVHTLLHRSYGIRHTTIQTEAPTLHEIE
jgi:cobalt-zinc-cadmium efflux system protein